MLALALILLSQVTPDSRVSRVERVPGGRAVGGRSGVGAGQPLCDVLAAGDKAGSWWCMKGDGTMLSGSAVTLTPTGSPTNSTENGRAVRTYTAAQNDQEPANAAFPASDFSVCKHHRSTSVIGGEAACFGSSVASNATFVAAPFEQQGVGSFVSFVSNGASISGSVAGGSFAAGQWRVLCFTYQRVADGSSVGTLYVDGTPVGTSSTMRLAQALASVWSTNGCAAAANSPSGTTATRGMFVTYKLLSAADVARISSGAR